MSTKFDEVKEFCLRNRNFRFSDLNRALGFAPSSMNSHTTYLNYLVRNGYMEKNNGRYKVADRKRLRNAELSDVLVRSKLKRTQQELSSALSTNNWMSEHRSKLAIELGEAKQSVTNLAEQNKRLLDDRRGYLEKINALEIEVQRNQHALKLSTERIQYLELGYFGRFLNWVLSKANE